MTEALLAFGGNVGDSRTILAHALALFCDGKEVRLVARSSDYRTAPWGFKFQASFINFCATVETTLAPRELLHRAQVIELQLGRDRAHEKRWGPRTVDIDIVAYDDLTMDVPNLTLPHPHLFERAFVLAPLAEIAPERIIAGRRIIDVLEVIDTSGVERLAPSHAGAGT